MDMESPCNGDAAEKTAIAFWMERVLRDCERAAMDFARDPVHDLRVALRRCRSIAAGFIYFDPARDWVDMRKEATRLFKRLGELRDSQVMAEWVGDPGAPADDAAAVLAKHLAVREAELKKAGAEALNRFDRKRWLAWSSRLSDRAARIPTDSPAFRHLALEHWEKARYLHHQALRNRSHVAYHRLRIGLKKFRYITENFLPGLHQEWGPALRELQDLLGEMHDLHVLFQTAISIEALSDKEARSRWCAWIAGEIRDRQALYRGRMTGRDSHWRVWRTALPQGAQLESAALGRLQTWASFRDPDCARSVRVARLALRLYDSLERLDLPRIAKGDRPRSILRVSALLHAVGRSRQPGRIHKESCRLVRKLDPPIGWTADDFRMVALVIRYCRGALPAPGQKDTRGLPAEQLRLLSLLSGVLRLADSLAAR